MECAKRKAISLSYLVGEGSAFRILQRHIKVCVWGVRVRGVCNYV